MPYKVEASSDGKRWTGQFKLFQTTLVFAGFGDGLFRLLVPLLALNLTRSPELIGFISMSVWLPWLLFSLLAGVVVDRFNPMVVLRLSHVVRLALVLFLLAAALSSGLSVGILVVSGLLIATAEVFISLASQTMVPRLVGREGLKFANGRVQSIQMGSVQLLGPAAAGFVVALGAVGAFANVTALYTASFVFLLFMASPGNFALPEGDPSRTKEGVITSFKAGFGHFSKRADLVRISAHGMTANFVFTALTTILPLWVVAPGPLGLSTEAFGFIMTSSAVGGMLVGWFAHRVITFVSERSVFFFALPALAVCVALLAAGHVVFVVIGLVGYGMVVMIWNVASISYRQRTVPADMFSRVNSVHRWLTWGIMPFGPLFGGYLGEAAGIRWVFLALTALLVVVFIAFPLKSRHLDADGGDRTVPSAAV